MYLRRYLLIYFCYLFRTNEFYSYYKLNSLYLKEWDTKFQCTFSFHHKLSNNFYLQSRNKGNY